MAITWAGVFSTESNILANKPMTKDDKDYYCEISSVVDVPFLLHITASFTASFKCLLKGCIEPL